MPFLTHDPALAARSPALRWFVALLPPTAIQAQATEIIEDLTERYHTRTAKAPPHITLMPPFELTLNAMGPVKRALREFSQQQEPVQVTLDGFSAFPPRVLFINVMRSPQLLKLKTDLEDCLVQRCDLPQDRHSSFNPHVTVASRKLNRAKFEQMWTELKPQQFSAAWESDAVTLLRYEKQGWQVEQTFALGQRES